MSANVGVGQSDEEDGDPIPISALQHAVYCLRQAALIHIERSGTAILANACSKHELKNPRRGVRASAKDGRLWARQVPRVHELTEQDMSSSVFIM